MLWLMRSAVGSATVAALEIGAVALALQFGYAPALAILFTVPLCVASVAGGIWVSVRNRMASRRAVIIQLAVMTFGAILAALQISAIVTVVAAVLIGVVLAARNLLLARSGCARAARKACGSLRTAPDRECGRCHHGERRHDGAVLVDVTDLSQLHDDRRRDRSLHVLAAHTGLASERPLGEDNIAAFGTQSASSKIVLEGIKPPTDFSRSTRLSFGPGGAP